MNSKIKKCKNAMMIAFSSCINFVKFKTNGVTYKTFPRTRGVMMVSAAKKKSIDFGSKVVINSGRKRNPVGLGIQTSILTLGEGKIKIGNNVGMSNVAIVSMNSIIIEDNVMIGSGAVIYDTDFHSINYDDRLKRPEINIMSAPVNIGEGAFIGAGVLILKGVSVGKHSIIGAGSVLTKSVPDNEIWAGNPAKFVKKIS